MTNVAGRVTTYQAKRWVGRWVGTLDAPRCDAGQGRGGGEIGIRTLDTRKRILDFESSAFDHSAISPRIANYTGAIAAAKRTNAASEGVRSPRLRRTRKSRGSCCTAICGDVTRFACADFCFGANFALGGTAHRTIVNAVVAAILVGRACARTPMPKGHRPQTNPTSVHASAVSLTARRQQQRWLPGS